eukprot:scaffold19486_cov105-Skeletonema_dohrnii-CCMP3373.AAC.8
MRRWHRLRDHCNCPLPSRLEFKAKSFVRLDGKNLRMDSLKTAMTLLSRNSRKISLYSRLPNHSQRMLLRTS